MFFTLLFLGWILFLVLAFFETRLQKSGAAARYKTVSQILNVLSWLFVLVYAWNLSGNINPKNIVMTTLMLFIATLTTFLKPHMPHFKGWLWTRNGLALFNALTIFVHFVIFNVVRS